MWTRDVSFAARRKAKAKACYSVVYIYIDTRRYEETKRARSGGLYEPHPNCFVHTHTPKQIHQQPMCFWKLTHKFHFKSRQSTAYMGCVFLRARAYYTLYVYYVDKQEAFAPSRYINLIFKRFADIGTQVCCVMLGVCVCVRVCVGLRDEWHLALSAGRIRIYEYA